MRLCLNNIDKRQDWEQFASSVPKRCKAYENTYTFASFQHRGSELLSCILFKCCHYQEPSEIWQCNVIFLKSSRLRKAILASVHCTTFSRHDNNLTRSHSWRIIDRVHFALYFILMLNYDHDRQWHNIYLTLVFYNK